MLGSSLPSQSSVNILSDQTVYGVKKFNNGIVVPDKTLVCTQLADLDTYLANLNYLTTSSTGRPQTLITDQSGWITTALNGCLKSIPDTYLTTSICSPGYLLSQHYKVYHYQLVSLLDYLVSLLDKSTHREL